MHRCGNDRIAEGAEANNTFPNNGDWIFASPVQLGRLPGLLSLGLVAVSEGCRGCGIGRLGTHSLRHSYRSWLDAVGTAVAVQQKLMRRSDIRTTFNIYGDVVTNEMAEAHAKIVRLAIPRAS